MRRELHCWRFYCSKMGGKFSITTTRSFIEFTFDSLRHNKTERNLASPRVESTFLSIRLFNQHSQRVIMRLRNIIVNVIIFERDFYDAIMKIIYLVIFCVVDC